MKLQIEISLDNAAMSDSWKVSQVVREVADTLESAVSWTQNDDESYSAVPTGKNKVRDLNGNSVGHWEVTVL